MQVQYVGMDGDENGGGALGPLRQPTWRSLVPRPGPPTSHPRPDHTAPRHPQLAEAAAGSGGAGEELSGEVAASRQRLDALYGRVEAHNSQVDAMLGKQEALLNEVGGS